MHVTWSTPVCWRRWWVWLADTRDQRRERRERRKRKERCQELFTCYLAGMWSWYMDLPAVLCRCTLAGAEFGQVFLSVSELNSFCKVCLCKICPFNTSCAGLFLAVFTAVSARRLFSMDLPSCLCKASSTSSGNSASSARYLFSAVFYTYLSASSARCFSTGAFYTVSAYSGTFYTVYASSASSASSARGLFASSFHANWAILAIYAWFY